MNINRRPLLRIFNRLQALRSVVVVPDALTVIVITHDYQASIALLVAGFQQSWDISIATSLRDALKKLGRHHAAAIMYDLDSGEADWREVCALALENRLDFHLIVRAPTDELFMAVVAAGGSGVLWKPIGIEQVVSTIHFGRTLLA